jgi:Na+/proline symporter
VQFFKADAFGLYEAIPGFIVGGLATVVVSRLNGRPTQAS